MMGNGSLSFTASRQICGGWLKRLHTVYHPHDQRQLFAARKDIQMARTLPKKQTSSNVSRLASQVLSGTKTPTLADSKKLAASVLSQDETKGQKPKRRR